jgi:hypothetical protein
MIQSGTIHFGAGAEASPGWALHVPPGTDPNDPMFNGELRSFEFRTPDMPFAQAFPSTPTVVLSLAGIDAGNEENLRLRLQAEDVQPDEFNIRIVTWGDGLIYGVWVTWIAYD